MAEVSLSQLKYGSLAKKANAVNISELLTVSSELELPSLTGMLQLDKKHELDEKSVHRNIASWLCDKKLCNAYWVHDTHTSSTFLGSDLKPDFMVSTESFFPCGEASVAFFLDVKAGDVLPWAEVNIGQAAAYCIRILEISSPARRSSATCLLTNLYEAAIVQVTRKGATDFIIKKAQLEASTALFYVFNANVAAHGGLGRILPIFIGNRKINLVSYLGSGSTGVVYKTQDNYAAKFFIDPEDPSRLREKRILDILSKNKPDHVLLQVVVDSDESKVWPALLLSPVGEMIYPNQNKSFKTVDSFSTILKTLEYAHKQNIIHNDIRPDNIVVVDDKRWLLIDWAAAWEITFFDAKTDGSGSEGVGRSQAYAGCVSYASDIVLNQLAACDDSIEDKECQSYVIDSPSPLTDIISLFRTFYSYSSRISDNELARLRQLRGDHNFVGITEWWEEHLSPKAKDLEQALIDCYALTPDGIHQLASERAVELFPTVF